MMLSFTITQDRISVSKRNGTVISQTSAKHNHPPAPGTTHLICSTSVGNIDGGLSTFHIGFSSSHSLWAICIFQLGLPKCSSVDTAGVS